jgi:formate-dependent phosphoribosylglycinamide formyltransferase (GAR transformylase)
LRRPKVAILNEHPTWQIGLCEELYQRDIDFCEIPIQGSYFNISSDQFSEIDLVINRSSPSARKRKNQASLFFTLQLIEHFEQLGIPVINGSRAYSLELSKARQCQLFQDLGLPFPQTIVVNSAEQVLEAANRNLTPPFVLKPNIGGSGLGYKLFKRRQDLTVNKAASVLRTSLDKTAVLQKFVNPDHDKTYRVQMIGSSHLYTVSARGGGANKCLSPDCAPPARHVSGCTNRPVFAEHKPSKDVITEVRRIAKAGGLDTCGVEYLTSKGKRYYFDINALSVFADNTKVQFEKSIDPTARFVDLIEKHLSRQNSSNGLKRRRALRLGITRRTS